APWGPVESGDAFPCGLTTVRCTAVDRAGNVAEGSFGVLVLDGEAPVFSGPSTVTLVTDCAGSPLSVTAESLGVTATDNCDVDPLIVVAPASLGPGTTTVVCRATDDDGNERQKSVEVTVLKGPFELRFLRPLDPNVDNLIRAGRPAPIKVRVACDNVFESEATVTVDRVEQIDGEGSPIANEVVDDVGASSDNGTTMRLVLDEERYVFNLATSAWPATSGARFRVVVRATKVGHADTFGEVILVNR
ncbi:MAG: HYR domain-containing protein, partial [Planctomycetes bacterium]|nr:HYR domain-containing protein [Planctomycetota bacterium]